MTLSNGDIRAPFDIWLKRIDTAKYTVVVSPEVAVENTAFGEGLVATVVPYAAWRFDYGVNTRIVSTSGTMSGGFVTGSFSRAQLTTSTNVSGTAQVYSQKSLRYLPGFGGLARFTSVFASGTSNSEQFQGIFDTGLQDGFGFGYDGTAFGILYIRAGVKTWIPQSLWNGESLGETLIPQNGNIYQIRFQWLGYGNIYFFVFDKTKKNFTLVHTILYPNTSPLTSILNPTLRLLARISNTGNNTSLTMYSPSALGALEGLADSTFKNPLNVPNSFDAVATYTNTNNNHLLTIRNKNTFLNIANRVPVQINSILISRAPTGATSTRIRIYRNATTAGVRTFTDIDANNSPVDASITATTITSTNPEFSYTVSDSNTLLPVYFAPGELVLNPGESISIGVQDSGVQSTDTIVTVNWDELF